jgi:8-oxo-dGTP diphosphatase
MTVVAAIILRARSALICQRRADQQHAGKWEFPGGKVEPGEEPAEALHRELREELGVSATIGAEVARYEYTYPDRDPILLVFYKVTEFLGEPENLIFAEVRWEQIGNLASYDFLEGDVEFVRSLSAFNWTE